MMPRAWQKSMPFSNWYIYDLTKGMVISVLPEARAREREGEAEGGAR